MRKKISYFTQQLQNQNIVPLWALANEYVVYSAARGLHHHWENKSRIVFRIMKIASSVKLTSLVIFFCGSLKIIEFWIKAKKNKMENVGSVETLFI